MITRQDILDRASEWRLPPEVVEKDYVLGYLLASIAKNPETSQHWVFKGGTCLKKCFFETYRFSEDLDFTLFPSARYSEAEILEVLRDVARDAAEMSGLDIHLDLVVVAPRHDRLGRPTFEGRIAYGGPLTMPSYPRVKFDLTQHEPVIAPTLSAPILHPYPDRLPDQSFVTTYSLEELLAEKIRALFERTRPRDLYDVLFVLDNGAAAIAFPYLRELFHSKCQERRIQPPTAAQLMSLVEADQELLTDWDTMLTRQLPDLPSPQIFITRLRPLVQWLDTPTPQPAPILASAPVRPGETSFAPSSAQFTGTGASLEAIRFAGANRLAVEIIYNNSLRAVEPYSLRRPQTGTLLLYGWELETSQIKAFNINKISDLRVTQQAYTPRFRVELSTIGPLVAPPTQRPLRARRPGPSTGRARRPSSGTRYIIQCSTCGKRFYRDKYSTRIGKHKAKGGWGSCSGRSGFLVGTT